MGIEMLYGFGPNTQQRVARLYDGEGWINPDDPASPWEWVSTTASGVRLMAGRRAIRNKRTGEVETLTPAAIAAASHGRQWVSLVTSTGRPVGAKHRTKRKVIKEVGKVLRGALRSPGLLGFAFGALGPTFMSGKAVAATSALTGAAGYLSPTGSWVRRFAIGSGLGAGTYAAVKYGPTVAKAVGHVEKVGAAVKKVGETLDVFATGGMVSGRGEYLRHRIMESEGKLDNYPPTWTIHDIMEYRSKTRPEDDPYK